MNRQNNLESEQTVGTAFLPPSGAESSASRCPGFSLLELLIALAVLVIVAGIVTSGMVQMMNAQGTINNRTEMHSSVRSATELLQQEIGQAGRVTLPPTNPNPTLTTAVAVPAGSPSWTGAVGVSSTTGMFTGEQVVVDAGTTFVGTQPFPNQETVTISALTPNGFTATFTNNHAVGAPLAVLGAFNAGIVPQASTPFANGSDGLHLKLFGDINGDGSIVIINYDCSPNDAGTGTLTRSVTDWNSAVQGPTITLLGNLKKNPNNAACFLYQQQTVTINNAPTVFVTDVSVTLTAQTQQKDPVTHNYQWETQALLNVSPRNIFDIWERASQGVYQRVQPVPNRVTNLLTIIQ